MGNRFLLGDQWAVIAEYRDSGHESAGRTVSVLFDSLPLGVAGALDGPALQPVRAYCDSGVS